MSVREQGQPFSSKNYQICEALNCFAKAAKEINVKVGKYGFISLNLCPECIGKFAIQKQNSSNLLNEENSACLEENQIRKAAQTATVSVRSAHENDYKHTKR